MNNVNHTEADRVLAWQRFPRPLIQRDKHGRSYFLMGTGLLWELLNQVSDYFGQTHPHAAPATLEQYLADNSSGEPNGDGWGIRYLAQTAVDEAIHCITPPDPDSKLAGVVPVSLLFALYELLTKQTLPIEHPIREEFEQTQSDAQLLLPLILDDLRVVKGMLGQIDITARVNSFRIMMFS
ncbi:MAG: hypothetical protein KCHDKBKB_01063 [Elusimicrobia bacterium]|nr:hypothetical protein [Elusimicrobiota bacterium]